MSRYIDKDALIEAMGEEPYVWTDSADEIAERNQWLTDMHIIESAPTIEIIKCYKCKHWSQAPKTERGWCDKCDGLLEPNFFCADGEREGE